MQFIMAEQTENLNYDSLSIVNIIMNNLNSDKNKDDNEFVVALHCKRSGHDVRKITDRLLYGFEKSKKDELNRRGNSTIIEAASADVNLLNDIDGTFINPSKELFYEYNKLLIDIRNY